MLTKGWEPRSVRVPWERLPHDLRDSLQIRLGGEVVEATSQVGGFSAGFASRLRLGDGTTAFVKAVPNDGDPKALWLYEREARVAPHLPPTLPVARYRGQVTAAGWFALVFDDAGGQTPEVPWHDEDLGRVQEALIELAIPASEVAEAAQLEPWGGDPSDWVGWQRVVDRGLWDGTPTWVPQYSEALMQLEAEFGDAAVGDSLLHSDLRSDNILLRKDEVVFVDWAWAARGQAWIDPMILALTAGVQGHPDPETVFQSSPTAHRADPTAVNSVLSALAGCFVAASCETLEGNDAIRSFQRREAATTLSWLQRRLGWH